jgi:hypothetical protein
MDAASVDYTASTGLRPEKLDTRLRGYDKRGEGVREG